MTRLLRPRSVEELVRRREAAVPAEAVAVAAPIVEAVRRHGEAALRQHAERFGEIAPGEPLVIMRPALERALGADCPVLIEVKVPRGADSDPWRIIQPTFP